MSKRLRGTRTANHHKRGGPVDHFARFEQDSNSFSASQ
jgi:hypothetical protein